MGKWDHRAQNLDRGFSQLMLGTLKRENPQMVLQKGRVCLSFC